MGSQANSNGDSREISSNEEWLPINSAFATLAIHSGHSSKDHVGAPLVPPISLATAFEMEGPWPNKGLYYTRYGNPTRNCLESTLVVLEEGKHAFTFGSGCAAIAAVVSLLKSGDELIVSDDVYAGTRNIFEDIRNLHQTVPNYVDLTDENKLKLALKPSTKLIWVETPTNPMLKIIDIQKVVQVVKGYSKDILVAVDNTLLTAFYQKPLTLGADLSVCALTKFANGHSDVIMGSVVTRRDDLAQLMHLNQRGFGAVPSPFDCYLLQRSLKTLHVRLPVHMSNGLKVAKFLQDHPKVAKVFHPGLPSHPQYELARRQSAGHSGMVSFVIKDDGDSLKFARSLRLCAFAVSFGGDQTSLEIPYTMSKSPFPADVRSELGVTENLIRLSVGLEFVDDVIEDLNQALKIC